MTYGAYNANSGKMAAITVGLSETFGQKAANESIFNSLFKGNTVTRPAVEALTSSGPNQGKTFHTPSPKLDNNAADKRQGTPSTSQKTELAGVRTDYMNTMKAIRAEFFNEARSVANVKGVPFGLVTYEAAPGSGLGTIPAAMDPFGMKGEITTAIMDVARELRRQHVGTDKIQSVLDDTVRTLQSRSAEPHAPRPTQFAWHKMKDLDQVIEHAINVNEKNDPYLQKIAAAEHAQTKNEQQHLGNSENMERNGGNAEKTLQAVAQNEGDLLQLAANEFEAERIEANPELLQNIKEKKLADDLESGRAGIDSGDAQLAGQSLNGIERMKLEMQATMDLQREMTDNARRLGFNTPEAMWQASNDPAYRQTITGPGGGMTA